MMARISLVVLLALPAAAQSARCSEQFVKAEGAQPHAASYAEDEYFFSGALDKPVVGRPEQKPSHGRLSAMRKNEHYGTPKPDRIVVAPSGDIAYEYGTAHSSFDRRDNGQHVDFTAAYIRVWRVVNGSCRISAEMFQCFQGCK